LLASKRRAAKTIRTGNFRVASQSVSVGIIANPASGSDIRRLVSLGSNFGTQEKINIIQRTLVGLDAAGFDRLYLMPDVFHIGESALNRLPQEMAGLHDRVNLLDMNVGNCAEDSTIAARQMRDAGVGCIIVLGGDGTSQAVAKGCGGVPILPISTGTNNVVSYPVEGTVAGLAAGFVARFPEMLSKVAFRSKWLEILVGDNEPDMALVDVAVVEGLVIGSRAIWEPKKLQQAILTRAEPTSIGISSLGGFIEPISPQEPRGLHLRFGKPKICRVKAPLAPGLIASFGVEQVRILSIGDVVIVQGGRLLALDGEREIPLRQGQSAQIYLRQDGPWIVDVYQALQVAAEHKFLVS
jgi:predicted polyphosphate/ATP-dependent NAD kinase